jgi:antitoxin component YwqK of YwqJK toxin-antitoxin module
MKKTSFLCILCFVLINAGFAQSKPQLREGLVFDEQGNLFSGTALLEVTTEGITHRQSIQAKDGLLDGVIIFYHPTGYTEEKGNYKLGKKDGLWTQYSASGKILGEAYYKDGLKDGIWTIWDEQGIKRYHMVYSMGKKVDTWKMWDEHAALVSERIYNE